MGSTKSWRYNAFDQVKYLDGFDHAMGLGWVWMSLFYFMNDLNHFCSTIYWCVEPDSMDFCASSVETTWVGIFKNLFLILC